MAVVMRMGVVMVMIMPMGMFMAIKRQRALGTRAEKRAVFGGRCHLFGVPRTADMPVEADHPVRSCHHHMQLMADHHNGTAKFRPYLGDAAVKGR